MSDNTFLKIEIFEMVNIFLVKYLHYFDYKIPESDYDKIKSSFLDETWACRENVLSGKRADG